MSLNPPRYQQIQVTIVTAARPGGKGRSPQIA